MIYERGLLGRMSLAVISCCKLHKLTFRNVVEKFN
jgi:hypothetical protein